MLNIAAGKRGNEMIREDSLALISLPALLSSSVNKLEVSLPDLPIEVTCTIQLSQLITSLCKLRPGHCVLEEANL